VCCFELSSERLVSLQGRSHCFGPRQQPGGKQMSSRMIWGVKVLCAREPHVRAADRSEESREASHNKKRSPKRENDDDDVSISLFRNQTEAEKEMPLRFLVQALNYFAHEVMVPRLSNSPFFQRFVVKTNHSLKNLQDAAIETVQEKGFLLTHRCAFSFRLIHFILCSCQIWCCISSYVGV
jgi:hypothetical protein